MDAATTVDHAKSWVDYLPTFFTQPETVFLVIIAFSTYGYCKTYPKNDHYPEIPQSITMAISLLFGALLNIGGSRVYGSGMGIIAAWGASSFYDLGFSWLTNKLRNYFGRPSVTTPPNQNPPTP